MADYFTTFSCLFDVGNAENVTRASKIREALATELDCDDGAWLGFAMTPYSDGGPGVLWLHSEEHGEPEHVIRFVLRCAEAFDLQGLWGFCWGLTCSRLRLDGFGGGAQLIDLGQRTSIGWIDCETWLAEHMAPKPSPAASAARVPAAEPS